MIYNFNLGIGRASSGVEYAQLYRARMLRAIDEPARFIFTDMFPRENIEHYTKKMGFKDKEILWRRSLIRWKIFRKLSRMSITVCSGPEKSAVSFFRIMISARFILSTIRRTCCIVWNMCPAAV